MDNEEELNDGEGPALLDFSTLVDMTSIGLNQRKIEATTRKSYLGMLKTLHYMMINQINVYAYIYIYIYNLTYIFIDRHHIQRR